MQKRLKPTAVPHIFKWSDLPSTASTERIRRGLKRKMSGHAEPDPVAWVDVGANEEVATEQTEGMLL